MLVNNRRYVSSNDLQTVPYSLVKRIDVVTGGASAAYGSDAVAGVVNIILDDEKEGAEVGVQRGVSTHGDAEKTLVEASFGTSLFDDRAHLLIGADYLKDDGIIPAIRRPRIGAANFFPGASGGLYPTANLREARRSEGGLINTGVLAGLTFDPDGSLRPFQYGVRNPISPNLMIGGEGYHIDQFRSVVAPIERTNVMGRFSLDVTDYVQSVDRGQLQQSRRRARLLSGPRDHAAGRCPTTTRSSISRRRSVQLVQDAGETTFTMGRAVTDVALARYDYDREAVQATVGFDGELRRQQVALQRLLRPGQAGPGHAPVESGARREFHECHRRGRRARTERRCAGSR